MTHSTNQVPLPPKDAEVHSMACQYCVVGCGYKSYVWPTTAADGGPAAEDNALGAAYPVGPLSGQWISPAMHNVIRRNDGKDYNLVIVPDRECVVNHGNYSRGGSNAQSVWSPYGPTQDRLKFPMVKVGGAQQPISWEAAIEIMAETIGYAKEKWGGPAMAIRFYAYQFYENTFPITKFYFGSIGTPNGAIHNRASMGGETTALSDIGIDTWGTAYEDATKAQTVVAWGANLYECQDIFFSEHVVPGRAPLVAVDPRKTFTAAYAEANGGVHLQVVPGTDVVLAGAIARLILENGWEDKTFIANAATAEDIALEENWRRKKWAAPFEDYKAYVMGMEAYALENAAKITGVPAEKITMAAELIAKPNDDGTPRKVYFAFEKGAIWNINYETVGSIGNLVMLTGSTGAEGRGVSRAGGHQEGYAGGADYPMDLATDTYEGNKIPNYIDQHMADGEIKIYHVVGANPLGMTNSAQWSRETIMAKQAVIPGPQSADTAEIIANFKERMDKDGMLLFAQDIYENLTTQNADLVLPAAGWGEMSGSRWNGERRLRLSEKFMDAPGEAKPDWWIIAQVAQKMGFEGYGWADENEIFTESAGLGEDFDAAALGKEYQEEPAGHESHAAVIVAARLAGKTAYEMMSELGTNGVQLPARLDADGKIISTPRVHSNGKFDGAAGKPMFLKVGWDTAEAYWNALQPDVAAGEFWLTNGRIEEIWQTMYTSLRNPEIMERWPSNIVEINADDAAKIGVVSGDIVSLSSDRIATKQADVFGEGSLTAVAYITDAVPSGVLWTNFAYPNQWMNNVSPRWMNPVNPVTPFKLSRAKISKIGSTDLAERISFQPRNIVPATS